MVVTESKPAARHVSICWSRAFPVRAQTGYGVKQEVSARVGGQKDEEKREGRETGAGRLKEAAYVAPGDFAALLPSSLLLYRLETAHDRHLNVAERHGESTMRRAVRCGCCRFVLGEFVKRFLTVVGDDNLEAGTLELTKEDFLVDEVVLGRQGKRVSFCDVGREEDGRKDALPRREYEADPMRRLPSERDSS